MLELDTTIAFSGIFWFEKSTVRSDDARKLARAAIFLVRLKRTLVNVPEGKDVDSNRAHISIDKQPQTGSDCYGLIGPLPRPDDKAQFLKFIDDNHANLIDPIQKLFDDFSTNGGRWKQKIDPTIAAIQEVRKDIQELTVRVGTLEKTFGELRGEFDSAKTRFAEDVKRLNRGVQATKERVAQLRGRVDKQDKKIRAISATVRRKYDEINVKIRALKASLQAAKGELTAVDQANSEAIERLRREYDGLVRQMFEASKTAAQGLATSWLNIDVMKIQGTFTARVFGADARLRNLSSALVQGYKNYRTGIEGANDEHEAILKCIDSSLKAISGATPPPFKVIVDFARRMRSRIIQTTDLSEKHSIELSLAEDDQDRSEVSSDGGDSDSGGGGSSGSEQTDDPLANAISGNYDEAKAKLMQECNRLKRKVAKLAKQKFGSLITFGWTRSDVDIQAIETRFTAARDVMVQQGNELIASAMTVLINTKLVEQLIESAMKEDSSKASDEIAEEVYKIVSSPFDDFFSKWAPEDATFDVWTEAGRQACADSYEIMFYAGSFEANELARTSVVEIPASIIRRFVALGFVTQQVRRSASSGATVEAQRTFEDLHEEMEHRAQNQVFTSGGLKGTEKRARTFARSLVKVVKKGVGGVVMGVKGTAGAAIQGASDLASRIAKTQDKSSVFYARGEVPWREGAQGNNTNHAIVLKLACINFMNNLGGDPATHGREFEATRNPWDRIIRTGVVPLADSISFWGKCVDSAKKGTVLPGRRGVSDRTRMQLFARVESEQDEE